MRVNLPIPQLCSATKHIPKSTSFIKLKENLVVIMGATGAGKSKLSVDLATRFSGEIINSDKIQVYRGLDITTNKIPLHERYGVPHHLFGEFESSAGDVSSSEYCHHASAVISDVHSRRKIPFLVGGSNSYIHALLSNRIDPESDPFGAGVVCPSSDLRYRCCFLWVDVSFPVLNEYLEKRVDDMMKSGMLEELEEYNASEINSSAANTGIRKAIGVPELEGYFGKGKDEGEYEEAVREIKENTCRLAKKQVEKIVRLGRAGWDLRRLDATDAIRGVLEGRQAEWKAGWDTQVLQPSLNIVKRFLLLQ